MFLIYNLQIVTFITSNRVIIFPWLFIIFYSSSIHSIDSICYILGRILISFIDYKA